MEQLAVDVTDIPDFETEMVATLIEKDGINEIIAASVAADTGKITSELLSRMGQRLPVVITE